jgi:hypothetical protein
MADKKSQALWDEFEDAQEPDALETLGGRVFSEVEKLPSYELGMEKGTSRRKSGSSGRWHPSGAEARRRRPRRSDHHPRHR